ncbi:MAG: hypothetical protein ABIK31_02910, partial [candidate division WOR-3 bacterium]
MKDFFTEAFGDGNIGNSSNELKKLSSALDSLKKVLKDVHPHFDKFGNTFKKISESALASIQSNEKMGKEFFGKWRDIIKSSNEMSIMEKYKVDKEILNISKFFTSESTSLFSKFSGNIISNFKKLPTNLAFTSFQDSRVINGISKLFSSYIQLFSNTDVGSYFSGIIKLSESFTKTAGVLLQNLGKWINSVSDIIGYVFSVIGKALTALSSIVGKTVEYLGKTIEYLGKSIGFLVGTLGKMLGVVAEIGGKFLEFALSVLMNFAKFRNELDEKFMHISKLISPTRGALGYEYGEQVRRSLQSGFNIVAPNAGLSMALNSKDLLDMALRYIEAGFSLAQVKVMESALGIFEVAKRAYGQYISNFEELAVKLVNFSSKSIDEVSRITLASMQMVHAAVPSGLSKKAMMEAWGSAATEAFQYGLDTISVSILQSNIMSLNNELKSAGVDLNKSMRGILTDLMSVFKKWGDGFRAYMATLVFGNTTSNVFSSMLRYEFGRNATIVRNPDGTRQVIDATTGKLLLAGDNKDLLELRLQGIVKHLDTLLSGMSNEDERFYVGMRYLMEQMQFSAETAKAIYFGGGKLANLSEYAKNELKFKDTDMKAINIRLFTEAERQNTLTQKMLELQMSAFQVIISLLNMIVLGIDALVDWWGPSLFGYTDEERQGLGKINQILMKKNLYNILDLSRDVYKISGLESAAKSLETIGLLSSILSGKEGFSKGQLNLAKALGDAVDSGRYDKINEMSAPSKRFSGLTQFQEGILNEFFYKTFSIASERSKSEQDLT